MKSYFYRPLYNKVVSGLPVLGTPAEVAGRYLRSSATIAQDSDRLIAFYTRIGGATGFALGLPGFLALPITLPADIVGTSALQLHMAAALAFMADRNLRDPDTRDECIACVLQKIDAPGKNTEDEEVANRLVVKLAERATRFAVEQATRVVGRRVTRRLPVLGGVLGAGTDAYVTRHIGRCAKETFLGKSRELPAHEEAVEAAAAEATNGMQG